jgi:ribonuclease HII
VGIRCPSVKLRMVYRIRLSYCCCPAPYNKHMTILGIDEVGRGCWAGPLVAGAVVLASDAMPVKAPVRLRDSKKLTKRQREMAAEWIRGHALAIGLGWVTPEEIDEIGLTESVRLAMRRAFTEICVAYDDIIIDGNINYFPDEPLARAIIKADDSIPSVSAASVVAKVARDSYMSELDEKYACYDFSRHVGYGTPAHIEALKQYGVSDIHRLSYKPVKAFLADSAG